MGSVDFIEIKCQNCNKLTSSQTKILGINEFISFGVGNKILEEEFANCTLKLKSKCEHCDCENAIVIENYKITGVTNPKYATCVEKIFGDYEWIGKLEETIIEKLKQIEGGKKVRGDD